MKSMLTLLLVLEVVLSVSAVEKNLINLKASESDFGTKDAISWRKYGGFQLKKKTFGAIKTKKRLPYSHKAMIIVDVKKLMNVNTENEN